MLTREEYVAKLIRDAILRAELKPGERLDQTKIARQLKVSRTPVRNALLILSNEGLIDMSPHMGAVVAELPQEEIEEIFIIRSVLEGSAARLAVERMTDSDLHALEQIMDDLDATSDIDEWLLHNRRFHERIYSLSGLPRLLSLITSIHDLALPYSRRYVHSSAHQEAARDGHSRILEACRLRDGPLAEQVVQEHIRVVCKGAVASHIHTDGDIEQGDSIQTKG